MDIERIRFFITVAECLSFTKAAEQMYISQPTLSRHIADLESTLNVELFERTTRKVSLTTAGELFLKEASQIIKRYDMVMERVARLGNGLSGSLRVGYLELFTQEFLPAAIRCFRTKFPLVDLQLKETTQRDVQKALLDGSLDMGFVITRGKPQWDTELEHRRILTGQVELIVGNNHPYAGYKMVSPAVLKDEQILTFEADQTPELREEITKMCMEYDFLPNFVTGDYTPGAIFLLVQAGMGVSLLSSLVTSVLRTEERFRNLKLERVEFPTNLEVAWRRDNHDPCIRNFLNEVEEAAHPGSSELR